MGLAASCAGQCESDPHRRCESREDFFVESHERLGGQSGKKEPSGPLDLCEGPSASRLATVSPPPVCERHSDGRYTLPYENERGSAHGVHGVGEANGFPRRLEVASPNGCCHCEGTYTLLPDAASRPVWRSASGRGDRWLYLSSGRWYIDGSTAEEAGFACSSGFLRSGVDATGVGHRTPLEPLLAWERGVDYRWHSDADVVIREAKAMPSRDAQQILRSAEMQDEIELSVEFMESCLDVQHVEEQPVHTAHLAFTSLADVRAELEKDDWVVNRFLREEIKATDITSLPMLREPAQDSEGVVTASRRTYFTMPVPQDNVPTIVSLLSGLPDTTRVTAAFGFQARVSELTLVQWTAMHHVIFGENFRVRDTLSFRPHPDRGVEFRRWTEVVWVKDLPVLHEAFRSTLEERILMEGMRSAEAFSRILDSESRRRRIVAGERVTDKAVARPERGMVAPAPHAEKAKAAFSLAIRQQSDHVVSRP